MVAGTSWQFHHSTGRSSEIAGRFVSPSFSVGLGCKVKRHQAVESAPYCEGHGGAVQQPVGVAALQMNGNAVCRLREETTTHRLDRRNLYIYICALIYRFLICVQYDENVMRVVPERSSVGPEPCSLP